VLDGRLLHNNSPGIGEIGHVKVTEDGERCPCGNTGCLETLVSTHAIVQRVQAIARETPDSQLHRFAASPEAITFETVCHMFQAGDPAVRQVVQDVGQHLGVAAANLVGILGSCHIALSGRVRCFGQSLLDAIRGEMSKRCLPTLAQDTDIGFVTLSSNIVLLGASALLMSNELGLFAPTQALSE
jgi:predicted NBD/HSP70 family sugar kinase